jgi:carbohydrate-selective porin OprB
MLLPGPNGKGGLAFFARAKGAPAQRGKVSAELDIGIVYQGPFGRDSDNVGFAVDSNDSAAGSKRKLQRRAVERVIRIYQN